MARKEIIDLIERLQEWEMDYQEVCDTLKTMHILNVRRLATFVNSIPKEKFTFENYDKFHQYMEKRTLPNIALRYDPEYIMCRFVVSDDEAKQQVAEYKKRKVTSKEGFVSRYGEEKGTEKFQEFQKTSGYPSSDEWFKLKYGINWRDRKSEHFRKRSPRCIEHWIDKGYTEDESKIKVIEHQNKHAGVFEAFWKERGCSDEEINVIFSKINEKKGHTTRNRKFLMEKYPDTWQDIYDKASDKYRQIMEEQLIWIPLSLIHEWRKYCSLVGFYTTMSLKKYNLKDIENISLHGLSLDHKFSKKQGFLQNVSPEIIGSIDNLEIIPFNKNASKRDKCSISKKKLIKLYEKRKKDENQENQLQW